MQNSVRRFTGIAFGVALFGVTAYAYAHPGMAACALLDILPVQKSNSLFVDVGDHERERVFSQSKDLIYKARRRIESDYGKLKSKPNVVVWSENGILNKINLNPYASGHFLGSRSCLLVGPKGLNIDVVAHELMHAELFVRVGPWGRSTQIPVWFDEGLAMQVDHRPKYVLGDDAETSHIRMSESYSDFFSEDDEQLSARYAAAKLEVARWLTTVQPSAVFSQLERIRSGESFSTIINR